MTHGRLVYSRSISHTLCHLTARAPICFACTHLAAGTRLAPDPPPLTSCCCFDPRAACHRAAAEGEGVTRRPLRRGKGMRGGKRVCCIIREVVAAEVGLLKEARSLVVKGMKPKAASVDCLS